MLCWYSTVRDGMGKRASDAGKYHASTAATLRPRAPELNPVENVWQYLRNNKLAITVFDTYAQILDNCSDAWNFFESHPECITPITQRNWEKVRR